MASDTYLEAVPSGHIEGTRWISNTRDADKPISATLQTAIDSKMSKARFVVVNTLPASPVGGLGLVAMPRLALCKFTSANKVYEMLDPVSGIKLTQATDSLRPTIHIDDNGVEFLRFNNSRLICSTTPRGTFLNNDGQAASFVFVAKTTKSASRHFDWSHQGSVGGIPGFPAQNITTGIGGSFPGDDGKIEVRMGLEVATMTSISAEAAFENQINMFSFVRDRDTWTISVNAVEKGQISGSVILGDIITSDGTLVLGGGMVSANMDFYGLAAFPKVLTPLELRKMYLFAQKNFGA